MIDERRHYNVTLFALATAGLAYALQQTMVLPALPALQHNFHSSTTWTTWIFTGFLLSSSVLTPILGKLGDQHGKERLLAVSLAIFLAGSIGAAAAWNIWSLIGWRVLQGAGAAVFPLSFAIINDELPREKAATGIGAISAVMAAGGGLGLPLSGVIVDHLSWRWLFVIGAIAVATAFVLVVTLVPESPIKTPSPIDYVGAGLLSAVLVSFLVAMSEGERWGWTSVRVLGLFVAAAVLLPVWVQAELRQRQPLVDIRMLSERTVALANATGLLAGFSLFGAFVLIPQFVQTPSRYGYGFGGTATDAGLVLLPGAVLGLVAGPLAGRLGRRHGFRAPLALGMGLSALGLWLIAIFHARLWELPIGMAFAGVGVPFAFAAMAKLVIDAVRPFETGVASGMNTVMRTVGGVVGGQVMATVLTADTIARTNVPAESAYQIAFWTAGAVSLLAAVVALFVAPRSREALAARAHPAPAE